MLLPQVDYKYHANKWRSSAPQYKFGNKIWLNTKNLITKRPSRKLENVNRGKYAVKWVISPYAVEFKLYFDLQVYLIFRVNLLEVVATDPLHPGHMQPLSHLLKVDG